MLGNDDPPEYESLKKLSTSGFYDPPPNYNSACKLQEVSNNLENKDGAADVSDFGTDGGLADQSGNVDVQFNTGSGEVEESTNLDIVKL